MRRHVLVASVAFLLLQGFLSILPCDAIDAIAGLKGKRPIFQDALNFVEDTVK